MNPKKTRTRAFADAATARAASCDAEKRSFCVLIAEVGQFLFLNFENQFYCRAQALQARGSGPALSVRAGHFRAEADKPLSIPLNDGRELAGQWTSSLLHRSSLTRCVTSGKPSHGRAFSL